MENSKSLKYSVKARVHHGTKSLDLTIPTRIVEKYSIEAGDVFTIEVFEKNGIFESISFRKMK
jgi:hypothetical protein